MELLDKKNLAISSLAISAATGEKASHIIWSGMVHNSLSYHAIKKHV